LYKNAALCESMGQEARQQAERFNVQRYHTSICEAVKCVAARGAHEPDLAVSQ
jgi:hypothetical protein